MTTDLKNILKSKLAEGVDPDELYITLEKAEDEYNEEKAKREKEEAQKKVKEELKKRAADDFYNAYVVYFNNVYPSKELPKDSKELFNAELQFIDYMMTGQYNCEKTVNNVFDKLLKDLAGF